MATETNCSLVAVVEKRHITIGWHQMGHAANAIRYILNCSLGQYRQSLNGVLLAIGKTVVGKPLCIADQPCMHIDLEVNCIVFRPELDHVYKCTVISADKKFVTAKLYSVVTFLATLKKSSKKPLNAGDEVLIRFTQIEIKGSLCQMKGTVV
ncbi:unnamed protein product [Gongylonema pulchrum]|uniref:GTP_EFTU_D3 domain-containing protein n=1 Tax=Gongylonema pulchrum TaxID=637853 RepID=A0A183DTV5_9BILA|nr:unnamed protein product [Gongylonema pulchrum]